MFAVVEFKGKGKKKREVAIVPLIWLTDDRKYCHWPRNLKGEADFQQLVTSVTPFQKTWKQYSVYRVLHTSDDYDMVNDFMNKALDEGTTEDGDEVFEVTKKLIVDQESDTGHTSHLKRKKKNRKQKNKNYKKPRKEKPPSPISTTSSSEASPAGDSESSNTDDNSDHQQRRLLNQPNISFSKGNASLKNVSAGDKENRTPNGRKSASNENVVAVQKTLEPLRPGVLQEGQNRNLVLQSADDDSAYQRRSHSNQSPILLLEDDTFRKNLNAVTTGNVTPKGQKSASIKSVVVVRTALEARAQRDSEARQYRNHVLYTPQTAGTSRRADLAGKTPQSFQEIVLDYLDEIKVNQQENKEMLIQILQTVRTTLRGPQKPDGMPDLPIRDLHVFEIFDEQLTEEAIRLYIQNRLLAVGGVDLRGVVMGMMREVMTDSLATHFNWKGHCNKISLEKSNFQTVIRESTKRFFRKKLNATDREIISAIQDWLKQSKNRLDNRLNRSRTTTAV